MDPMTTNDIIGLVLVYALIVVALLLSLVVEKKLPSIDSRKVVHIGVGNFVFVWWMFTQSWVMLVFFTIPFAVILFIAMFRGNAISESKLGELTRKGHNTGLFLYAITITVLVILFFRGGVLADVPSDNPFREHWLAASIAIMAMTYGDGFGSAVGRRIGKHKIIHGKSLEGSIGVFCATTIMACVMFALFNAINGVTMNGITYCFDVTGILPWFVIAPVIGLLSAVLEALCNGDYDNFVNPIIIGLVLVAFGL